MDVELRSDAEKRAQQAEMLSSFGGVNLLHIKRQLEELLRHIGEEGIFAEYTRHDIQHVEAMLNMLDWLIPESTKEILTPADWLMTVLSIYFHDIGLLVTKEEYESKSLSTFPQFRDSRLLTPDPVGRDYADRVARMDANRAERFLYQEYVRAHHAERIRLWLENPRSRRLGAAEAVANEVVKLLEPLGETFRSDLGYVCESHHLDDLDDVNKYRVRRHYGNRGDEVANLQYAAILLRTVDLLHITRDRAPSISFRALNPTDPKSQEEWQKQMAVLAVGPRLGRDRDGNLDEKAPRNTIEVHGNFSNAEGFFSLTSYLSYAARQLDMSYKWVRESRKRHAVHNEFPWRDIDQSNIETKGFLARQFEFQLDQYKILELLTGHTLYNDTNVVLRELTQNAIDAVRLQYADETGHVTAGQGGEVQVAWDPDKRILEVRDDGTGMTQEVIEQNLLKVGASLYQEPKFRDQHPRFSPISRFGIGVLSTFMIADSVEIVTSHPSEQDARSLSLRSVHGKYLIRLLSKDSDEVPESIREHGTIVRLLVRPSADIDDVAGTLRRWFVLPKCSLMVLTSEEDRQAIGFNDLASFVNVENAILSRHSGSRPKVEIRHFDQDGVEVAYGVLWSEYFREWGFAMDSDTTFTPDDFSTIVGTCVEGVRVKFSSPGYQGRGGLLAIANASGPNAPRTNVARSEIEDTPEYQHLLRQVYKAYGEHVREEVRLLHEDRGFSKSRAAAEARFLAARIVHSAARSDESNFVPASESLLRGELRNLPFFIVDDRSSRYYSSLEDLSTRPAYHVIDNAVVRHAEMLARDLPGDVSLEAILSLSPESEIGLPPGPILDPGLDHEYLMNLFYSEWEPTELSANVERRRLDLKFTQIGDQRAWRQPLDRRADLSVWVSDLWLVLRQLRFTVRREGAFDEIVLPAKEVSTRGLDDFDSVRFMGQKFMLPGRPWEGILQYALNTEERPADAYAMTVMFLRLLGATPGDSLTRPQRFERMFDEVLPRVAGIRGKARERMGPYLSVSQECMPEGVRIFDTRVWERGESNVEY
jgi:molecular chaperone HtpG